MRVRALIALGAGVMAISATACVLDAQKAGAEGEFTRTLTVTGPVDLDVRTGQGDIHVTTGPAGTVQVNGHVRVWQWRSGNTGDDRVRRIVADPPIEQSGNLVRLHVPDGLAFWEGVSVSFDVTVPPDTRVLTRSGSGEHIVGNVGGPVDASSGSGRIRIGSIGGDVRAAAGSGDIDIEGSTGSLNARAGSGSITVMSAKGDVDVHTGSGTVSVTQAGNGRADINTGSGSITVSNARGPLRARAASGSLTVSGRPADTWILHTASGSVSVSVPADASFDLDARTSSGRIASDHPVTVMAGGTRGELRGQVRGGGPRVEISTASGSVSIR
jgi:DUF4097 and DUF4098 domain-containing protein YvlB